MHVCYSSLYYSAHVYCGQTVAHLSYHRELVKKEIFKPVDLRGLNASLY